jgi:hypothetical protein
MLQSPLRIIGNSEDLDFDEKVRATIQQKLESARNLKNI